MREGVNLPKTDYRLQINRKIGVVYANLINFQSFKALVVDNLNPPRLYSKIIESFSSTYPLSIYLPLKFPKEINRK